MMTNIEYLGIFESWIDKTVEMCETLAKQAGVDTDRIDEAVYDYLYSTPIYLDKKKGVNISTVIMNEYFHYTTEIVEEELQKLGFTIEDFSFDYNVDGYYSDLTVNNNKYDCFLEEAANVLKNKFADFKEVVPEADIAAIIQEALESSEDVYDLIGDVVSEITNSISEKYGLEIYATCDNRGFNLELENRLNDAMSGMKIDEFMALIKQLAFEKDKKITRDFTERND